MSTITITNLLSVAPLSATAATMPIGIDAVVEPRSIQLPIEVTPPPPDVASATLPYAARLQVSTPMEAEIARRVSQILKVGTIDEVMGLIIRDYPEMGWLTGSVNATPEGTSNPDPTQLVSQRIFGAKHTEFDRTAVGIMTFLWVIRGEYEAFTACQPPAVRLSRENFSELRRYTIDILHDNPQALDALIVYTVINDLGKIKAIVDEVQRRAGTNEIDHDKILYRALDEHPDISPSFNRLSAYYKRLIVNGLKAQFNLGQFVQGENVPASLSGLTDLDRASLDFYLLHVVYDIAGAAGQVKQNGSLVMSEPTYQGFRLSLASLAKLARGWKLAEVYDDFLASKGEIFGLDVRDATQRAAIRISCMLRLNDGDQAKCVLAILSSMPRNERAILERELNRTGVDDGYATLLYYAPATLANAIGAYKSVGEPLAFEKAVRIVLKTFARVYQEARIMLKKREGNGVYTVDIAALAEAAKKPEELDNLSMRLNKVGDDAKLSVSPHPVIDAAPFSRILSLAEIPGRRIVPIGIGGGSDVVQAAIIGRLLREAGKDVPAVVSIRTAKTGSQGVSGAIGETRVVMDHGGEIAHGIFRITPQTTGTGRFLENIPADQFPVYLIIDDDDGSLADRIRFLMDHLSDSSGIDRIVAVDTGGDALYSTSAEEGARATPDQDLRVLSALANIGTPVTAMEVAVGVDSPDDAQSVLLRANAGFYLPSDRETDMIMSLYTLWGMTGDNEARYGKTPMAWQLALLGQRGFQSVALPTRVVVDGRNPWNPFVLISDSMRGLFVMKLPDHLRAIGVGQNRQTK